MPVEIPNRSPWTNFRLVIGALLHREVVSRFGRYKMGALWLLTEPLVGVIVLGLLLGPIVGRTAPDMPYAFFLLNGFVVMRCFTGPMTAGIGAVKSNLGLLVFPKVQPLDLLLAKFLFELAISLLSFITFCLVGMWFGVQLSLGSLHLLLLAFLITWLLGSGVGLLLGVAAAYSRSVDKILAFIRRPLLFISCVLIPYSSMPAAAQKVLYYNPLVHTIEISRRCLFPFYHLGEINLIFPSIVATVIFSIGLCLFHNNRHFLAMP